MTTIIQTTPTTGVAAPDIEGVGMPRNTYQDYVTYQEMCDSPIMYEARRSSLINRSGVFKVSSGVLTEYDEMHRMMREMRVSFDSRAWTGLA